MNTTLAAPVYLDHNATTAPRPEAVAEMLDVLRHAWANPSSTHAAGQAAKRVLVDARLRVARLLGCLPAELIFTSGATEANHSALRGALAARRTEGRQRLLLSAVEHPGLLQLAQQLQREGVSVDLMPVDAQGRLDLHAAQRLMGPDVALVA
jgi:cysteine desulfurase